jgi:hypothetical protein
MVMGLGIKYVVYRLRGNVVYSVMCVRYRVREM